MFEDLVKASSSPESATLWVEPERDKEFMMAVKENRIVTLCHQITGSRMDFGVVGFFKDKNATYLIFPKKLNLPAEVKVVGFIASISSSLGISNTLRTPGNRLLASSTAAATMMRRVS